MIEAEGRWQTESEFETLVDAVPQHLVVLHGDGRRLYANQAVRRSDSYEHDNRCS